MPLITEALALFTRLSVSEFLEGWTKEVVSPAAISNPCQSMIAFSVDCVTVSIEPEVLIAADPAEIVPPEGFANTAHGAVLANNKANKDTRRDGVRADLIETT